MVKEQRLEREEWAREKKQKRSKESVKMREVKG